MDEAENYANICRVSTMVNGKDHRELKTVSLLIKTQDYKLNFWK